MLENLHRHVLSSAASNNLDVQNLLQVSTFTMLPMPEAKYPYCYQIRQFGKWSMADQRAFLVGVKKARLSPCCALSNVWSDLRLPLHDALHDTLNVWPVALAPIS
jgi:hypothetical protein